MTKKTTKKQTADAASFMAGIELKSIRLLKSQSEFDLDGGKLQQKVEINTGCEIGHNDTETNLKANISCDVVVRKDGSETPAVLVKCKFQAVYQMKDGTVPSASSYQRHAPDLATVAMHQMWPFVRRHVQDISSQMGLPAITLPLFHTGQAMKSAGTIASNVPPKLHAKTTKAKK